MYLKPCPILINRENISEVEVDMKNRSSLLKRSNVFYKREFYKQELFLKRNKNVREGRSDTLKQEWYSQCSGKFQSTLKRAYTLETEIPEEQVHCPQAFQL